MQMPKVRARMAGPHGEAEELPQLQKLPLGRQPEAARTKRGGQNSKGILTLSYAAITQRKSPGWLLRTGALLCVLGSGNA